MNKVLVFTMLMMASGFYIEAMEDRLLTHFEDFLSPKALQDALVDAAAGRRTRRFFDKVYLRMRDSFSQQQLSHALESALVTATLQRQSRMARHIIAYIVRDVKSPVPILRVVHERITALLQNDNVDPYSRDTWTRIDAMLVTAAARRDQWLSKTTGYLRHVSPDLQLEIVEELLKMAASDASLFL